MQKMQQADQSADVHENAENSKSVSFFCKLFVGRIQIHQDLILGGEFKNGVAVGGEEY